MANFIPLTSAEETATLFDAANDSPVILFKHSTTCPISMSVYHEVSKIDADVHLVIVQNSRPVSNLIAERSGIRHESPQAIVIKNGAPIFQASHFDITAEDLTEVI